jgi:membrane-associated phospholipid phosphatase
MNSLRRLLHQKAFYFIAFSAGIIIAIILFSSKSKINCFIELNGLHSKWLDVIFINLTFLGDGLFSMIAAALLLFVWKLRRISFHIIIAFLFSGIVAQILKRLFMAPRPKEIIESSLYNSFINGVTGVGWHSFPSGHTTSVFALATILALHSNKKRWGLFFLMIAALVGYSRIYLGQHFLQDVVAGALLGTATGIIVYSFINFPGNFFKRKRSLQQDGSEAGAYSSNFAG